MKIAVTYENGLVFQHFGHTETFKIFELENNKIVNTSLLSTLGSGHCALAGLLKNNNVDILICGGIGGGAINALTQSNIKVYAGVHGPVDEVVKLLLKDELEISLTPNCDHHDHHEHGDCHHDEEHHCHGDCSCKHN